MRDFVAVSAFGEAHIEAARRGFGRLDNQAKIAQLHLAAARGSKEAVQFCIDNGLDPNIVNPADGDGLTALCHASKNGHADIVEMLLSHPGTDPEIGEPLVLAVDQKKTNTINIKTITLLLQTPSLKLLHQTPYVALRKRDNNERTVLDRAMEKVEQLDDYQQFKLEYGQYGDPPLSDEEIAAIYTKKEKLRDIMDMLIGSP